MTKVISIFASDLKEKSSVKSYDFENHFFSVYSRVAYLEVFFGANRMHFSTKVILTQKSIEFIGIQPEPIETLEIGIYLHLQIIYETYVLRARVRFVVSNQ